MSIGKAFQLRLRRNILILAFLAVVLVGWLDYVTGWEWSLFIFYAFPIGFVVRRMGRSAGFAFAILCAVVWFAANFHSNPYQTSWGFGMAWGTRLFYFSVVVIAVAAAKDRAETNLERIRALERARELELEILRMSEEEKQRIGQDLHDGVGPHLAAIGYAATFLANELRDRAQPEAGKAEEIRKMAMKAVSVIRDLARGIFPVQMDGTGLATALEELARSTSRLTGLSVSFCEAGNPHLEDPGSAMHLYRIAQEAMTNALRHGNAGCVTIGLQRNQDTLRLWVADDGTGIATEGSGEGGFGLRSMRYRARAVGGVLKVESTPNEGTILTCELPCTPTKHHIPAS